MHRQTHLWYKLAALLLALSVLVPVLAACGSSSSTPTAAPTTAPTATATATTAPTATVAPTATPTSAPTVTPTGTPTATPSNSPVLIGAADSWSGPMAMGGVLFDNDIDVVQAQLQKMGGILGGRPVKIVKYDDRGSPAQATAGYEKLVLQDHVSCVIGGGTNLAIQSANMDAAGKFKVPVFIWSADPPDLSNLPYVIRAVYPNTAQFVGLAADLIINKLKAKTVAVLATDVSDRRNRANIVKQKLTAAGIKIIDEQYAPIDTTDYSSYLTRVKYDNPDVLFAEGETEFFQNVFKQISGLGGWGNIKFVSDVASGTDASVINLPGSQGTYHWALWVPGLPYPGAKEFEQAFLDVKGKLPGLTDVYGYYVFWVAIKAIQLANSDDPAKIAQAARSGNLKWDGPAGPFSINPDGSHTNSGVMMQIQGGKLVLPQ